MTALSLPSRLPFVRAHYYDKALNDNPHAFYRRLRRESPVCRTSDFIFRGRQGYMVTRYDDVRFILTDRRFSSSPLNIGTKAVFFTDFLLKKVRLLNVLMDSMVLKDDPDHRRLRGIVNMAFTNRAVSSLEPYVQRTVDEKLDRIASSPAADFVRDFAIPLPLAVISEMLGLDAADRDDFARWMKKLSRATTGDPLQLMLGLPTGRRMLKMFRRLIEDRRTSPDDRLISAIIQAHYEGERLDDDEVLGMIFLLLLAGHDTTANLIGMSGLLFAERPALLDEIRDNPARIDTAVEELLRFTAPVTTPGPRIAMEDVEIGGVRIARGSPVLGMIISANRDETVFDDPDTLDLSRSPNPHLGFGFGGHICLGIMLARLEARVALQSVAQRFRRLELAVPREQLRFRAGTLRGLTRLPLKFYEKE